MQAIAVVSYFINESTFSRSRAQMVKRKFLLGYREGELSLRAS
jgi:hypothetical protein